jgi:hypothetical protein
VKKIPWKGSHLHPGLPDHRAVQVTCLSVFAGHPATVTDKTVLPEHWNGHRPKQSGGVGSFLTMDSGVLPSSQTLPTSWMIPGAALPASSAVHGIAAVRIRSYFLERTASARSVMASAMARKPKEIPITASVSEVTTPPSGSCPGAATGVMACATALTER